MDYKPKGSGVRKTDSSGQLKCQLNYSDLLSEAPVTLTKWAILSSTPDKSAATHGEVD